MNDFQVERWKDHLREELQPVAEHLEHLGVFFVWRDAMGEVVYPPRLVHPATRRGQAVTCEVWHQDRCLLKLSRSAFDDGVGPLINQLVEQAQQQLSGV